MTVSTSAEMPGQVAAYAAGLRHAGIMDWQRIASILKDKGLGTWSPEIIPAAVEAWSKQHLPADWVPPPERSE